MRSHRYAPQNELQLLKVRQGSGWERNNSAAVRFHLKHHFQMNFRVCKHARIYIHPAFFQLSDQNDGVPRCTKKYAKVRKSFPVQT
jgi:hypothetical protein